MSDDHQRYCTSNQLGVIRVYAGQHGLEVVKVFSDEGRSGLTLQRRPALSQLISEVLSGAANISHILVYDVSRWGRFQDTDEAAHYEFLCRKAGVTIHNCAEEFPNDGTLPSVIAKSFKRAMAGEFSRELSAKVSRSNRRLARPGYWMAGTPGLGLRRMLVDQHRQPKTVLGPGQWKQIQNDRVVLVSGPEQEIKVVRGIFQSFVEDRLGPTEIARRLNCQGIFYPSGCPWTGNKIGTLLRNEKYIGNIVYGKWVSRLGTRSVPNPPERWVRAESAFPAIVSRELFFKAQARFKTNDLQYQYTEAELLGKLRALRAKRGYLTQELINESSETPPAQTYFQRFGSLAAAYRLIGFQSRKPSRGLDAQVRQLREELVAAIVRKLKSLGSTVIWDGLRRQIVINGKLRVRIYLVRHDRSATGASCWRIHHRVQGKFDFTLAARLDRDNQAIKDFYLLPHSHGDWQEIHLTEGTYLDSFRCGTLDGLVKLAAQSAKKEAA